MSRSTNLLRLIQTSIILAAGMITLPSCSAQYGQGQGNQGQQGSYAAFGPTQNMNMNPTQGNPFIGSWFGKSPLQDGSGNIVSFTEYLPNGTSRATTIVQGGSMNGMRMQLWGKYSVKQIGQNRYQLTLHLVGYAPRQLCSQGGGCQPNSLPSTATEIDDMQGTSNYHSHSEMNGMITDVDVSRAAVPPQLMSAVGPTLTMAAPQQFTSGGNGGGGAAPVMPTLHPYVTPGGGTYHVPGQGGTCDDAQQNRICTINNGHMYTNSQGCQICRGPN